MNDRPTFATLGVPFDLFQAPASDAADFVPNGRCSLCDKHHPVCFELRIGADVIVKCGDCGTEAGLDADDSNDGNCAACGEDVAFPPLPEDRILCCYRCLREGKAAITKDTQFGVISFKQIAEGLQE